MFQKREVLFYAGSIGKEDKITGVLVTEDRPLEGITEFLDPGFGIGDGTAAVFGVQAYQDYLLWRIRIQTKVF